MRRGQAQAQRHSHSHRQEQEQGQGITIKICGLTRLSDALAARELGASMLGFVFAESPRQVSAQQARAMARELPGDVLKIGVFVDEDPAVVLETIRFVGLDAVQLHGNESLDFLRRLKTEIPGLRVLKGIGVVSSRLPLEEGVNGCGKRFDDQWDGQSGSDKYDGFVLDSVSRREAGVPRTPLDVEALASGAPLPRPLFIAGGLNAGNVIRAIRLLRPDGVDVSSSVETRPGEKDVELMRAFIEAVQVAQAPEDNIEESTKENRS